MQGILRTRKPGSRRASEVESGTGPGVVVQKAPGVTSGSGARSCSLVLRMIHSARCASHASKSAESSSTATTRQSGASSVESGSTEASCVAQSGL